MDKRIWMLMAFAIIGFSLVTILFGAGGGAYSQRASQPQAVAAAQQGNAGPAGAVQDVYIHALPTGSYDKPEVHVKAGNPVRLHFIADPGSGCGAQLLMEEFNVNLISRNSAEQVATFTPSKPGTYEYHCGMHMFVGRMVVE
ncbi:MAG: cupredoxin domain-containing protein [Candidatus Micrarchaeia archaeon]